MKIDSEHVLATVNQFKNDPVEKGETSATAGQKSQRQGTDRVELSVHTAEIERLKTSMQEIPDVRSDKVNQLKEQIAAGSYRVEGKEVAEKMLANWSELHGK